MKISLCLIVKNEETHLNKCLESVYKYVDEIIITDTGSSDKTIEIAKKYTDKIHFFEWIDDFATARNFCQSHATWDYIFWMDADEWYEQEDISKLTQAVRVHPEINFFSCLLHHIQDRKLAKIEMKTCIFKNNNTCEWKWSIHEILDTKDWDYWKTLELMDVRVCHDLQKKNKLWNSIDHFIKIFPENKENNTIVLVILKYFLDRGRKEKLHYYLKEISSIHILFLNDFLLLRKRLEAKGYIKEKLMLNRLIHKSFKKKKET